MTGNNNDDLRTGTQEVSHLHDDELCAVGVHLISASAASQRLLGGLNLKVDAQHLSGGVHAVHARLTQSITPSSCIRVRCAALASGSDVVQLLCIMSGERCLPGTRVSSPYLLCLLACNSASGAQVAQYAAGLQESIKEVSCLNVPSSEPPCCNQTRFERVGSCYRNRVYYFKHTLTALLVSPSLAIPTRATLKVFPVNWCCASAVRLHAENALADSKMLVDITLLLSSIRESCMSTTSASITALARGSTGATFAFSAAFFAAATSMPRRLRSSLMMACKSRMDVQACNKVTC